MTGNIVSLELDGLKLITPIIYHDQRGYFYESYNQHWLHNIKFVQANHVLSMFGTLRGLHYQAITNESLGQDKLIRVTRGKVLDVAVDIRKNSVTLGKWVAIELSEENKKQLFIPIGFAHGYYVMSDIAEVQYLCSNYYNNKTESGIKWDDQNLHITWPNNSPNLSDRDKNNQSFMEYLET